MPLRLLAVIALSIAAVAGPEREEAAAFRRVSDARDALRAGLGGDFEREARDYLALHAEGASASVVWLWLGDFLRESDPRAAADAYGRSREAPARERAEAIRFRHEAPPALDVERWIGAPPEEPGSVRLLVFFSLTHPQTARVLARLSELQERHGEQGLRVVGIASVIDDRENQKPEMLDAKLRERTLPFPIAVDRQREGGRSASLALYRGNRLPWAALLDRYDRIRWLECLPAQGNAAWELEGCIAEALREPTLELLATRAREGDARSLEALAAIRTRACADALFGCAEGPQREGAMKALRTLLPEGFLGEDVEAAAARWKAEGARYRFSFDADRLVAAR